MDDNETPAPDAPPPLPKHPPPDMDRVRANREIGRAYRAIQAVRTTFIALAVLNGVLGFILLLQADEYRGTARTIVYVVMGMLWSVGLLYVVGTLRLKKEPFLWALVVSLLQSLIAITNLLGDFSVMTIVMVVVAAGCWGAFLTIAPAVKLMRQYPDLRITQRAQGRRAGRRRPPRRNAGE